jgi:hypothetical protein
MSPVGMEQRLKNLAEACELEASETEPWRKAHASLSEAEAQKFQRLVRDVEKAVYQGEDCGAIDRLEQGVTLANQTTALEKSQADARAAQASARDILSRPEFQVPEPAAEKPDPTAEEKVDLGPWERFLKWLAEWLSELFKNSNQEMGRRPNAGAGGQTVVNVLVVVLIAGVLVVLVLVLLRALGKDAKDGEGAGLEVSTQDAASMAADPTNALSRPPEGWAHLADELAARGEYREAVRSLYLALLSRLHREGVIHYDTTLSNWDYLRQFKGHREWLPPFRELTRRFDFAWYGNLPVGVEGYRDFRTLCAPMLATPATQEAASA